MAEIEYYVEFDIVGEELLAAFDYANVLSVVPENVLLFLKQHPNHYFDLCKPDLAYNTYRAWDLRTGTIVIPYLGSADKLVKNYLRLCYRQRQISEKKKRKEEEVKKRNHFKKYSSKRRNHYGKNLLV